MVAPGLRTEPARGRHDDRRARRAAAASALLGAALFGASWFLPWWNFHLVAPQYPQGLDLQIALWGVTGAVAEIDILNHYIGMQSLAAAAAVERALSGWLIAAVALTVLVGSLATGRRLGWIALVPAIGLPVGFVADSAWWMWRFGHRLDPSAPIDFPEFTPVLLGPGAIGQFQTWGWPAAGFWVASLGVAAVVAAVLWRRRVCRGCPLKDTCGPTCPRLTVRAAPEQR